MHTLTHTYNTYSRDERRRFEGTLPARPSRFYNNIKRKRKKERATFTSLRCHPKWKQIYHNNVTIRNFFQSAYPCSYIYIYIYVYINKHTHTHTHILHFINIKLYKYNITCQRIQIVLTIAICLFRVRSWL